MVRTSRRHLRIINKTRDTARVPAGFRRKRERERERSMNVERGMQIRAGASRAEPSRALRGATTVSHLHIEILREQIFLKVPPSHAPLTPRPPLRPPTPFSVSSLCRVASDPLTSSFFLDLHTRLRMMLFTVRHVSPNSSLNLRRLRSSLGALSVFLALR